MPSEASLKTCLTQLRSKHEMRSINNMKSITEQIIALTVLSLCATPLARAGSAGAVEAKLKSMEDTWAASQFQKDHGASVVQGLLADDYFGVNAKGKMQNKTARIESIRNDTDTYTSSKNDQMEVHLYGDYVATVCGISSEAGKDKNGKHFSRSYAWVDTWMERNGQWHCITGSGTLLTK